MNSRWNELDAPPDDRPLACRVYSSRLLGADPSLVLHGGGNTSVKVREVDFFGDPTDVLYVKGSGWDLATIEERGFSPVRMDVLLRLAQLDVLTDGDMVRQQRLGLMDPSAPNPSVEAILHALVPHTFVDHTHADAIVTMTNTPDGEAWIRDVLGPRAFIVPYVMPGFDLCKLVATMTTGTDWNDVDALVLMNHGLFTFGPDARSSYESMIHLVDAAERAVARRTGTSYPNARTSDMAPTEPVDSPQAVADLCSEVRFHVSRHAGQPMVVHLDRSAPAVALANDANVADLARRGPATPDHVIRTKPHAMVLPTLQAADVERTIDTFATEYEAYVRRFATGDTIALDGAPRWIVAPRLGHLAVGRSMADAIIVTDIARHTASIALAAESAGGWQPLDDEDLFAVEYWELEQAKLRRAASAPDLAGKVALVTGAASGIGFATTMRLRAMGAAVVALDIDPDVERRFEGTNVAPFTCDVTDHEAVARAVHAGVATFGGIDVLVANAGFLPTSWGVGAFDARAWNASLDVNVTATAALASTCIPFLRRGFDPAIVVVGSKNVAAPGRGAAAYSVSKAALTQWARVAAIELAQDGIRVNVVHPDAVFDTALWSDDVIEERARHYGLSVEQYKTRNLLSVEITSADVANVVCRLASHEFGAVTGAQVPIDGGNERVI